jgi:hypothetical protein
LFIPAGIALVAAGAALGFAVRPRTGTLVVTVVGPGDATVEIYVNGRKRCDASPCSLSALEPGKYRVAAGARGYQPVPDVEIAVAAGGESHCALMLSRMGVTPYSELRKRSWCNCAPGDLKCAMECAANGGGSTQMPLDGASIQAVVSNFAPSVRRGCWEPAFNGRDAQAPSSARVAVQLTIAPSGLVEQASTSGDPEGYHGLAQCIEGRVRRWKFPRSAQSTSANVPFVFSEP